MNRQSDRIEQRKTSRQENFDSVTLPDLPTVPGMTTEAECRYYYWLTSQTYTGQGAIVELGTWLGRSSIHLAAGLRDSGQDGTLHCFDGFVWSPHMVDVARYHDYSTDIKVGDSFQSLFESNVLPVCDRIQVTQSDIRDVKWDRGPIEILILDAPKEFDDIISTLQTFGPFLIPGFSIISFQDFFHYSNYTASMMLSAMDEFTLIHTTDGGTTAAFMVNDKLDLDSSRIEKLQYHNWDTDVARSSWQSLYDRVEPQSLREILELHLCLYLCDMDCPDDACCMIKDAKFTKTLRIKFKSDMKLYKKYGALFWATNCQPHPRWTYPLWKTKQIARTYLKG